MRQALRLSERNAAELRARALAVLGLQPLNDALALPAGTRLAYVAEGAAGEAVVDDDANSRDPSIKVAIGGAPPAYVPRTELAAWCGGAADDFGVDADAWAWMGGFDNGAASGAGGGGRSSKKKRRR
jgi:hypothetical protein